MRHRFVIGFGLGVGVEVDVGVRLGVDSSGIVHNDVDEDSEGKWVNDKDIFEEVVESAVDDVKVEVAVEDASEEDAPVVAFVVVFNEAVGVNSGGIPSSSPSSSSSDSEALVQTGALDVVLDEKVVAVCPRRPHPVIVVLYFSVQDVEAEITVHEV